MKTGKTLVELATEIQNQQEQKKDYVLPAAGIRAEVEPISPDNERVNLVLGDSITVTPNEVMAGQLATVTGIPRTYYRRMEDEAPELLADNLNTWLKRDGKDRLVRTFQNGNNTGRALLSDRYRAMDYFDMAEAVLPMAQEQGLTLASADVTDRRLYLKFTSSKVEGEVKVGEVIRAGVIVTDSEVGMGRLQANQFLESLVCTNGMVREQAGERFAKTHRGSRWAARGSGRSCPTRPGRPRTRPCGWPCGTWSSTSPPRRPWTPRSRTSGGPPRSRSNPPMSSRWSSRPAG